MTTPRRHRIDSLRPGQIVVLRFVFGEDAAVFKGVEGEGDDRVATFESWHKEMKMFFRWSAYRDRRGWAYGPNAERVAIASVSSGPLGNAS